MSPALLVALVAAAAPVSPPAGEWAVVGLKGRDAAPVGETVALARGALALALGEAGRVLGPEETRARLGLPPRDLAGARERLDAAELYYFQLELAAARRGVVEAIEALVRAGGAPEAWEWLRVARLLLASIDLAPGTPAAREAARDDLLPLVRVRRGDRPGEKAYPAELLALFDEAARAAAAAPRGTLRVRCQPACAGAHVWVDAASADGVGTPIVLPAGTYHVVVTDSFDRPRLRSLTREVEVKADAETTVEVDLAAEGALDAGDGPSLYAPPEAALAAVTGTARRGLAERLVAVWSTGAGEGRRLHLAVARAPGGRVERQAQIRLDVGAEPVAVERLVRFAASGELGPGVEDASVPAPALAAAAPAAVPAAGWKTWTKWSAAAAALGLGATGAWLAFDAEDREDRLQARVDGWGGAVPIGYRDAVMAEHDAIGSRRDLGVGLLVGAGVASVVATTFFLLDDGGDDGR
jgi:hypothetical protein